MGGRVVEMEMGLFYRFAVIPLGIREPEEPLFQEVIFLIPEAESNVLYAMRVRNSRYAVLAPSICPRSSMVVREIYGSLAVIRAAEPPIVIAYGSMHLRFHCLTSQ